MTKSTSPCPLCRESEVNNVGARDGYPVARCVGCGLYFLDPMPSALEISEIYDDYIDTKKYLAKYRKKTITATYKQKLVGRYLPANANTFLDIGCNLGAVCKAAGQLGYQAMGIDLDEPTLVLAREMAPECRFERLTSYELAERGERFDLVFCTEVLEHVPEAHDFAASFRQLVKRGGILYLTTPDAGHRRVPKDFVSWDEVIPPQHLAWYSRKTLARLLQEHGFEIIRFRWCHRANLRVIARAV